MSVKHKRVHRDDHLKMKPATVLAAMRKGEYLVLEHRWFGRCWCLSGGRPVDDVVAKAVIENHHVTGVGDALFKGVASQTWRWTED
jgi:hypothetical protein